MTNAILLGDAIEQLKTLDSGLCDMCVTSPPYYGLRDYGVAGQIGLEETPEQYIQRLVDVFREVKRVLRDDGTLWVNIADSYCGTGSKGNYKDPKYADGRNGQAVSTTNKLQGLKQKDLIGIPWMLAFALRADGWYLRQDIIWAKPNPMPESVKDRCTKSHEYIFLLSKSQSYYYDNEAISEPVAQSTIERLAQGAVAPRYGENKYTSKPEVFNRTKSGNAYDFRPMRNKRDVWTVTTKPFKEAHFATYPPDLIRPCILAGSRKNGIVLDPFFGSGTTGLVATQEGRKYIGIDLNPEYIEISQKRIEGATKWVV